MEQKNKKEELRELILKESQSFLLNKGDSIFKIAGKYNGLYFLEEGMIMKGHHVEKEDIYIDIISSGEFITLREYFTNTSNLDIALVHSDEAIIHSITIDKIEKMVKEKPWIESYLKDEFGKEVKLYEYLSIESGMYTAKERIAKLIIRFVEKFGVKVGNEMLIELNVTHVDIAKLSQSSRQTVTTFLNKLRDLNYIYYDRRRLLVRDIDGFGMMSKKVIAGL